MGARSSRPGHNRARIASEAARLFVELGLTDFRSAKRKAVQSLRLGNDVPLPPDDEVEQAVAEYQMLFRADTQPEVLADLRQSALKLMHRLKSFSPRLVGPVLSGVADENSAIGLHLIADPPEAVQWFLMDRGLRFRADEVRLPLSGGKTERLPSYWLLYRGVEVELVVFSGRLRTQRVLTMTDGRVVDRADAAKLETLLRRTVVGQGVDVTT